MASAHTALETILLKRCWISEQSLERAREYRKPGQSLADSLIETRAVEPRRLGYALAEVSSVPFQASLDEGAIDGPLLARIGVSYARKNRILPLGTDGATVAVAAADPSKYEPLDDLSVFVGMPVQPVIVPFDVLHSAILRASGRSTGAGLIINLEERIVAQLLTKFLRLPLGVCGSMDTRPTLQLAFESFPWPRSPRSGDFYRPA